MSPSALDPTPTTAGRNRVGLVVAAIFGFPIGILSGFTGVGGGEYRSPVLLALLRNVRWAIAANLLVGLIVSSFNATLRSSWTLAAEYLLIASLFIVTSVPGAYIGALLTKRASAKLLKVLLAGILVGTGLRLILVKTDAGPSVTGVPMVLLALGIGFVLGIISGLLGLAAGEYRIPALILIFGVPVVIAGTLSALSSIPQQLVGFLKHRRMQHARPATMRLGEVMAAASVLGVAVGVAFLGRTAEAFVAQVLGAAMIAAAGFIIWDIWHPHPEERAE